MGIGALSGLLRHLRRSSLAPGGRQTDGQLLESFKAHHDEAAFAALVHRHGPMVLGVCRRVLGNPADAEDAFQATFVILVRKAPKLRQPEQVGNWLYGVAHCTAREARTRILRRQARERQVSDFPHPAVAAEDHWSELRAVIDRELARLPAKYREPLVLCDLEGRSRKEVAAQLHLPEGTLSSRLATARRSLAARLSRRGVTLSATALAAWLAQHAATAAPPALTQSTVQAATLVAAGCAVGPAAVSPQIAALVTGVMKSMFLSKVQLAAASAAAVALLVAGSVFLANQALADRPVVDNPPQREGDKPRKNAEEKRENRKAPKQAEVTVTGKVGRQEVTGKTEAGDTVTRTRYFLTDDKRNRITLPGPRFTEAGQLLDKFNLADFVGKEVIITGRGVTARTSERADAPVRVVRIVAITQIKMKEKK